MTSITLSALSIYPIKSAAGIALEQADLTPRGLRHDRRWMVVNDQGQFMTQRKFPKMSLIQVEVEDTLRLTAPNQPPLNSPLPPTQPDRIEVEVWGDRCTAIPMGTAAQQWLSNFLQVPCQLVYMPETSERPTDHGKFGPRTLVSFADAYPFLLISEASLTDLNSRLGKPIPMNRFRPNLVVRGCESFAEDTWQKIRIGEVIFNVAKPCSRCSIPSVDQATGTRGKEPTQTLAKFRRWDGAIWFGQNLIHENLGSLKIGDSVEILTLKQS